MSKEDQAKSVHQGLLDLTIEETEKAMELLGHYLTLKKFNQFTKNYDSLTFNDVKKLYGEWYRKYPTQNRYNDVFFLSCFKTITSELGEHIKVLELGGFEGNLAFTMLLKHPQLEWLNVEITQYDTYPLLPAYDYKEHILKKQIWEEPIPIEDYNVFTSSDTIEHLSNQQLKELLNRLIKSKVQYIILQTPIKPQGQTWKHYNGAHLLTLGSNQIKNLLKEDYTLIKEEGQWHSLWKRKAPQQPPLIEEAKQTNNNL